MNFWTYEEDDSQGYWNPPPPKKIKYGKPVLLISLFLLVVQLCKAAGWMLFSIGVLLLWIVRQGWKFMNGSIRRH